ncbi:MAG: hypothetical protein RIS38_943, partial [Verrucomicrobiota bacterium]
MLTWVHLTLYLAVACLGFHALASGAPEAPKPPPAPYRTVSLRYYHPVPASSHEAMRHEVADLTPGAYVIRWKHRMKLAANRQPPPYRLEVINARTGVV